MNEKQKKARMEELRARRNSLSEVERTELERLENGKGNKPAPTPEPTNPAPDSAPDMSQVAE